MTLDEYFDELNIDRGNENDEKEEENLFETSRKGQATLSKKLITY